MWTLVPLLTVIDESALSGWGTQVWRQQWGEKGMYRGMKELIAPVYFGGQDYCQMAQEMGCKKNDFYHLKRVKDLTKANSTKKGQPILP